MCLHLRFLQGPFGSPPFQGLPPGNPWKVSGTSIFGLKVEVVKLCDFEDIVDCTSVISEVGASSDTDIVLNADCCPKGFVFENNVVVDVVHHGLERCW